MIAKAKERWQAILDHPILQLELRRVRRRRWWPGRRFFLFYPVLMGAVLGCGVALALTTLLDNLSIQAPTWEVQLAALVTGLPTVCLVSTVSSMLAFGLSWIAPALTAGTIARERELFTFDLLRTTLLTERSIVLGKLGGCIAQLWPGLLALALLTPFQLFIVAGSGFLQPFFFGFGALMAMSTPGAEWSGMWLWLLVVGAAGLCRPWAHLALHTTIGLFVSTVVRSSGLAVAASYGVILVMRVALYLLAAILNAALMSIPSIVQDAPGVGMNEALIINGMMGIPSLTALGIVMLEFVGAVLLVWGSIQWLKRM
ncbi:MAG: hypothetical protein GY832_40290 [Chloroflexi bacterium]|nr:hypothetical protein [Chloroflexota bacterium]